MKKTALILLIFCLILISNFFKSSEIFAQHLSINQFTEIVLSEDSSKFIILSDPTLEQVESWSKNSFVVNNKYVSDSIDYFTCINKEKFVEVNPYYVVEAYNFGESILTRSVDIINYYNHGFSVEKLKVVKMLKYDDKKHEMSFNDEPKTLKTINFSFISALIWSIVLGIVVVFLSLGPAFNELPKGFWFIWNFGIVIIILLIMIIEHTIFQSLDLSSWVLKLFVFWKNSLSLGPLGEVIISFFSLSLFFLSLNYSVYLFNLFRNKGKFLFLPKLVLSILLLIFFYPVSVDFTWFGNCIIAVLIIWISYFSYWPAKKLRNRMIKKF